MLPEPLHPAVVHFPIVLVVLLPLFAVGALWAIRHGSSRIRAWALPVLVAAALVGSSWVALETGEAQEDTVEAVVAEEAIHTHEERAEAFLLLSIGVLALGGIGFARGPVGKGARIVTAVAAVGLIVAGVRVGASGGDLVYRHGAAQAYVRGGVSGGEAIGPQTPSGKSHGLQPPEEEHSARQLGGARVLGQPDSTGPAAEAPLFSSQQQTPNVDSVQVIN